MFDKLKQLKQMRDQAMALKRALAQEEVVVEEGKTKIVMSGDQRIKSLVIDGEEKPQLVKLINKAVKKSQEVAARKLSQLSGGLSGLLG